MSDGSPKNPTGSLSGAGRRVLVDRDKRHADWAPLVQDPVFVWRFILAVGITLTIVGWLDLAVLWHPLQFGNPEWEFGTISQQFDGMPLGTIGLAMLAAGLMGLGWRRTTRVVAVVVGLIALGLISLGAVYALDIPLALKGTQPPLHTTVVQAILKTTVYAVTYLVFYAWLAITCWRRSAKPA